MVWRGILTDLGAQFSSRESADVVFSTDKKISPCELKAEIIRLRDVRESAIIKKICGGTALSGSQKKIIIALHRAGKSGADAAELQYHLGYAPGADTNAVGTAIYQLRKIFGKEFIKHEGGKYKL